MAAPGMRLMTLIERVSQKTGKTYFTGYLGDAQVVVLKDERCESPRYGGVAEWVVFANEREQRRAAASSRQESGDEPRDLTRAG